MSDNNQVPGNQDSGKVSNPLTQPDGDSDVTSTQVTTAESQPDADVQALKEKLEALEDKSEKDIRAMKSSLQRRESELTKEWQEQERLYQDKIRQLELAGLDDEARAEYERNFTTERLTQLEQQLNQAQVELDQRDAFNAALTYFTQAGIAPSSLDAENGYEALIQSGWDALKSERDALKEQIAKGEVKPEPKKDDGQPNPPKPAPPVDTTTGGNPSGGPTWESLRQKYGSDEEVYRLVEQGQLSPSVIPVPEEQA